MNEMFRQIKAEELNENVFKLIGKDWMLITAGEINNFNTMTANWGALGILWHEPICICFIRPQRFTYEFIEKNNIFTLSFFTEKDRDILNYCGQVSGRETNKIKETCLLPFSTKEGGIGFEQARIIIEAQKIYFSDINPSNFIDLNIHNFYPKHDYHRMFVGKITNCLISNKI
jgi:flavin reductase (DIM6/NTAB) family NADH-FMN oxidoreductase RutF